MIDIQKHLYILTIFLFSFFAQAQTYSEKGNVYIDKNGVMRWENSRKEVKRF